LVLRTARDLGLPSVNAGQWLDFNDARRAVAVDVLTWDGNTLAFGLQAPAAVEGLTLLLPPWPGNRELAATLDGAPREVVRLAYEGLSWHGLVMDLPARSKVEVRISPRRA
jgi:hypothetical protein